MKTIISITICFCSFVLNAQTPVNDDQDKWETHPYFGYQYQNLGKPEKLIKASIENSVSKVSQLLSFSDQYHLNPKEDESFWLLIDLTERKEDSTLISFGIEQETRWLYIDIYSNNDLSLVAKGGVNCTLADKSFKTNSDVFRLSPKQKYLVNLKSIQRDRKGEAFNIIVYNSKRYFDFEGYTYPNYFHQAGGYLYDFNLIKRSLQVYCDSTNSASFEEVKSDWLNRAFVNYNEEPEKDLTYWMRFKINNPNKGRTYLMGSNSGSFWNFDQIKVFIPQKNGNNTTYTLGQKEAWQNKPFGIWNNVFSVQVEKGQEQEVFLKVKGFNSAFVPDFQVSHINEAKFWQVTSWIKFIYGFFLGLILVQFLYYFIRFFLEKEQLHLYFSVFVLGIGLWVSFFSTDLQFTPFPTYTQFNIPLASFGMSIATISIYAYQYRYLTLSQYQFPFKKTFWVLSIINTLICINYALSFSSFASIYPLHSTYLQLMILSLLINYLFVTFVGVYSTFKKNRFGLTFTIAFVPLLLGIIIRFVLALVLILQGGTYNQFLLYLLVYGHYVLMAGITFALIMMAINTAVRFNKLKLEKLNAEKFKAINEFKSRFYTNITHEFRTPLTAILGTSETLKENDKRDVIDRNSQKLLSLVNELLDISKAESTGLELNWVHSDIVPFITTLFQQHQPLAQQKGVSFELNKMVDSLQIEVDETVLDKIMSNLFSNAIKFTPSGGRVMCKVFQSNSEAKIEVSDSGIGIASYDLPHIFQRFYQAATASSKGTGVGLALAKELTEQLGGNLQVASEIHKGSVFTLTLPIGTVFSNPSLPEDLVSSSNKLISSSPNIKLNPTKPTILVIEDNMDVLDLVVSTLKNKYNILTAPNGALGVDLAIKYVPDIVITDVMMPVMDGYELCKQLKEHPVTDHIPIVMLTAKVDRNSRISGLEFGADAYINKPFDKEEIVLTIQNFLDLQKKLQDKFRTQAIEVKEEINPFLAKANTAIINNLTNDKFSAEALSAELNLSRSQLFRKIKALSGLNTQIYIRTIRLDKAKEMLQSSENTIAEVAFACGFSDPSYFTKVFNEHYKVLPSQIRLQ